MRSKGGAAAVVYEEGAIRTGTLGFSIGRFRLRTLRGAVAGVIVSAAVTSPFTIGRTMKLCPFRVVS